MARPPVSPLTIDDKQYSYFQLLAKLAYEYLKRDKIFLDFTGYNETIQDYAKLEEKDLEKAWQLAKDLNAWAEYFSGMSNLIQKFYLDAETSKMESIAISSLEADAIKVANGDRLANKDNRVIDARKRRNILKSFHDELQAKIKFLERAHYHCKATYDIALKGKDYETKN